MDCTYIYSRWPTQCRWHSFELWMQRMGAGELEGEGGRGRGGGGVCFLMLPSLLCTARSYISLSGCCGSPVTFPAVWSAVLVISQ